MRLQSTLGSIFAGSEMRQAPARLGNTLSIGVALRWATFAPSNFFPDSLSYLIDIRTWYKGQSTTPLEQSIIIHCARPDWLPLPRAMLGYHIIGPGVDHVNSPEIKIPVCKRVLVQLYWRWRFS